MTYNGLKSIVDRIERLEGQQKTVLTDKRAVYTEAGALGYNVKALRKIIAQRREKDWLQIAADMHDYQVRLGMGVNDVANGASLREAAAKHGVSKSTLHRRAVPSEEKSEMGQPADDDLEYPDFLDGRRNHDA
jgi:uncharacterized protein (UPF0335 family)